MTKTHGFHAPSLLLTLIMACDHDVEGDTTDGCEGAKCDDADDSSAKTCPDTAAMVELARDELIRRDGFARDEFQASTSVSSFDDVDGDGKPEVLVAPGIFYSGSNMEWVLFANDDAGCPRRFVGSFAASEIAVAATRSQGFLDVIASNVSLCEVVETTYAFDGSIYVEASSETIDICEDPDPSEDGSECATADELIAAARAFLVDAEPDFFDAAGFHDGTSIEAIGDVDADGTVDALVLPGWSYAGPNVERVLFLSDEFGCTSVPVGHFAGSAVVLADTGEHEGLRDLLVDNVSGCTLERTRWVFTHGSYVAGEVEQIDLCD
jgi:hypothetical protein